MVACLLLELLQAGFPRGLATEWGRWELGSESCREKPGAENLLGAFAPDTLRSLPTSLLDLVRPGPLPSEVPPRQRASIFHGTWHTMRTSHYGCSRDVTVFLKVALCLEAAVRPFWLHGSRRILQRP